MSRILFINLEDMKLRTEVPDNVDKIKIEKYIFEAQEQHIKPILCKLTYDRLVDGLNGKRTLTALEKELITKIEPTLIFRSYEKYFPFNDLVPHAGGFKKITSEVAENITIQDKNSAIGEARKNAAFYEADLIEWLNENFEDDTDWKNCRSKKPSGLGQHGLSTISRKRRRLSVTQYYDS